MRHRATVLLTVGALSAMGACASGKATTKVVTTDDSSATVASNAATSDATTAATSASVASSAAATVANASGKPTEGTTFTDPQGHYTMTIDSRWPAADAQKSAPQVEAWFIDEQRDGFHPNVNVQTEAIGSMDLAGYIDATLKNFGTYTLIDRKTVPGAGGRSVGVLEYNGAFPAAPNIKLHFLAVVDVNAGYAAVATMTTDEARFVGLRPAIEPYLYTLQAA